jgi:hypothetical protein
LQFHSETHRRRTASRRLLRFEPLEPRLTLDSTAVFNELMYHPIGNNADLEYVELFNQLATPIDLSGWRLSGGTEFSFANGTVLDGGEYLVVASSPSSLQAQTGIANIVGPFAASLSNSGELLELRDNNGRIMDSIEYADSGKWPVAADGIGASLAKRDPYVPSGDPGNWAASKLVGGTPGGDNRNEQSFETPTVNFTSPWKYDDSGSDLGIAWRSSDYNDSVWQTGAGLFFDSAGAAPFPKQTQLNAGSNTYYFRKTFDFSGDLGSVNNLALNTLIDDGAVFYLNGVEVLRQNMPSGMIDFDTSALTEVGDAQLSGRVTIPATNLVAGTNVLAVELHQYQPGTSSTIAYYRFEEPSGNAIRDSVTGNIQGQLVNGTRTSDVPTSIIPNTGAANQSAANLVDSRALIDGQTFLFHDPSVGGAVGGATLEWYMKVPDPDDHSAIFWSNSGTDDSNRFNIFWNASFTGVPNSDRTISGDYRDSTSAIDDIGNHSSGVALSLDEWHHIAIVRTDDTPNNTTDSDFTWNWYIDGALSPSMTETSTVPLPTSNNGWLIAGRQNSSSAGADILIDEIRLSQGALSPSQFLNANDDGSAHPDALFGADLRIAQSSTTPQLAINEIEAPGAAFQVEVVNYGSTAVDLSGLTLVRQRGTTESSFALPNQDLSAGQLITFNTDQLGYIPDAGDKLILQMPSQSMVIDAIDVGTVLRGRIDTGVGPWYFPTSPSFGSANVFALHNDIVINEIMYQHQVTTTGGTATNSPEEWIELYNRGANAVDLSGWTFSDAIDYVFPQDTMLAAGQYLVVANNATALIEDLQDPGVVVLGNFSRNLSNSSDNIILLDAKGNLADEVHYYDDTPWPKYADGGGSSLELRDPGADNSKPESWAASDETIDSLWQTYTYSGIAEPADAGSPQYNEFIFGLLDQGSVLLDDISVIEDPDGTHRQLVQNGTFDGGTTTKWRIIGNHHSSVITDPDSAANKVLRIDATGGTDDMHNHAETTLKFGSTFVSIVPGRKYEISFRAKWLGGSTLINTRLFFNRLQRTTRLLVPQINGTPGRQNSRYEGNIGPTFSGLSQSSAVPSANESVTISVAVQDANGVGSVELHWRKDGSSWNTAPMAPGADGRYAATVPGQTAGTIVQFYVRAADNLGAISEFPAAGEQSRALYVVDDGRAQLGTLHNIRVIMAGTDVSTLNAGTNLMSNDLLGATVVVDESQVYYDVGVRRSGASSSRQGTTGYRIDFNSDQLYLGVHEKITIDRNHNEEIFVRHLFNHAGDIPSMYNDVIYFVGQTADLTGLGQLRMTGFDDDYLESQFPDADSGLLFEKELIYRQQLSNSSNVESLKVPFGYSHPEDLNTDIADLSSNPEVYRWNWQLKNAQDLDNYSGVVALNQAFSLTGAALESATSQIVDVDEWLRAFAAIRLLGNRDFYSQPKSTGASDSWRHNFWVYERPDDGRFVILPWDVDENFQVAANDPTIFGTDNIANFIQLPNNLHYYWGHLDNLINTTFNATYMSVWGNEFSALLNGRSFANDESYIVSRGNYIRSRMPATVAFQVDVAQIPTSVDTSSITVQGQGWVNVREIRIAGRNDSIDVMWSSSTGWSAVVPLSAGVNQLHFEAYDFEGNLVETPFANVATVTSSISEQPYQDFLQISEIMYHPPSPTAAEILAGFTDGEDFEYLEFYNSSSTTSLDLTNVRITEGPSAEFNFGSGNITSLGPNEYVLVVASESAFEFRYGIGHSDRIAGQFSGRLNNAGEQIVVIDPTGVDIQRFSYSDDPPWPTSADGDGYSLVLWAPNSDPDHSLASRWTASAIVNGSPGIADAAAVLLLGDFDRNGNVGASDYVLWRNTQGSITDLRADGNNDRLINSLDYYVWRANYGNTGQASLATEATEYSALSAAHNVSSYSTGLSMDQASATFAASNPRSIDSAAVDEILQSYGLTRSALHPSLVGTLRTAVRPTHRSSSASDTLAKFTQATIEAGRQRQATKQSDVGPNNDTESNREVNGRVLNASSETLLRTHNSLRAWWSSAFRFIRPTSP